MRPLSNLEGHRSLWRATNGIKERTEPCFRIKDEDSAAPKLYVYDVIGGWDMDASAFVQEVHKVTAPSLDLHINSPGGFVFDAVSMFEALRGIPAAVNVHIDGLAASAASFLAMAGDSVDISKGGRMMIHDAQGVAIGNPADMREYADLLDAVSNDIAGYYADRAGGSPEMWRGAMQATTWYSSSQAVESKLADRVSGDAPPTDMQNNDPEDIRTQMIRARARVSLGR